ncbi:MAG TPA: guanine deaminase, partial [Ramlibacter sp.]|nr:guanine deaminase [Ramlibacter sp.]
MASSALRGEIVTFDDDPRSSARALRHHPDGIVVIDEGRVVSLGGAPPPGVPVEDHRGRLILPGFIDAHIHYPQTDVIASPGEQLLGWLER